MAQQTKEEEVPKEKTPKDRYALVDVTTQTAQMIQDTKDESILDDKNLLLVLINKIDKIEKAVA